jgi:hypothetical protein
MVLREDKTSMPEAMEKQLKTCSVQELRDPFRLAKIQHHMDI